METTHGHSKREGGYSLLSFRQAHDHGKVSLVYGPHERCADKFSSHRIHIRSVLQEEGCEIQAVVDCCPVKRRDPDGITDVDICASCHKPLDTCEIPVLCMTEQLVLWGLQHNSE